jgi:hypothetical protein
MVEVLDRIVFGTPEDILAAMPMLPPDAFSTRELAECLGCGTVLAQRTLYCLRAVGLVARAGNRGPAPLHVLA